MATASTYVNVSTQYMLKSKLVLTVDSTPMPLSTDGRASSRIDYKVELVTDRWSGQENNRWLTGTPTISSATLGSSDITRDFGVVRYSHNMDSTGSATTVIAKGSSWVAHNSDGSISGKTVTVRIKLNGRYIENYPEQTLSTTVYPSSITVDTASSLISTTSLTAGTRFSGTISNSSTNASSYTHTLSLYITMTGKTYTLGTSLRTGASTYEVPSAIGTEMAGDVATGRLTLTTYKGSTLVGSRYDTVTIGVGNTKVPTINTSGQSLSLAEGNSSVTRLSLGSNIYVSGISNMQFSIGSNTFTAAGSKTISRYGIEIKNGSNTLFTQESTSRTITINAPYVAVDTNITWNAYAIDSGGLKTPSVQGGSAKILTYTAPTVSGTASRSTINQTSVLLNATYRWKPLVRTNGVRATSLVITPSQSSNSTGPFSNGNESTITSTNAVGSYSYTVTGVSTDSSQYFRVTVNDGLSSNTVLIGSVGTEEVPLDLSQYGAGVGMLHDGNSGSAHLQVGSRGILTSGDIYNKVGRVLGSRGIDANTNLDNLTDTGMYYLPTPRTRMNIGNHPTGNDGMTLQVLNASSHIFQIAHVNAPRGLEIYMRIMGLGTWSSWSQVSGGSGGSSQAVDLSNYYTKSQIDNTFAKKTDIPTNTGGSSSSGEHIVSYSASSFGYLQSPKMRIVWGRGTVSSLNIVPTTSSTYYADATFFTRFSAKPFVVVTPEFNTANSPEFYITDVTTTGFQIRMYSTGIKNTTKNFSYIAIGSI